MAALRSLDVELEAVTPLWIGGADRQAELRPPSVQGLPAVLVPGAGRRSAGRGAEGRPGGGIGGLREHVARLIGGGAPVRIAADQ